MRSTTYLLFATCLTATLVLSGCGGGGSGGNLTGAPTETIEVVSDPGWDGVVASSGFLSFDPRTSTGFTGDLGERFARDYQGRQIYAFTHIEIPDGARVVSAVLRIYQEHVSGAPYTKLGNVVVDSVDYVADEGPETYDGQTLARNIGTLSTSDAEGMRTLDVTGAVVANVVAGARWSQFRLRFWREGLVFYDDINDYARFADAEDSYRSGYPSTLVITYAR